MFLLLLYGERDLRQSWADVPCSHLANETCVKLGCLQDLAKGYLRLNLDELRVLVTLVE